MDSFLDKFYNPMENESISDKYCFLCGIELDSNNRSDEHIIPSWVQDKYDLSSQRLTLVNKTSIPYRQLKIPCCWICNNNFLNPIEATVSRAVSEGIESVKSLDKKTLYIWLGKILYGLVYKELLLPHDRSNSEKGSILISDVLYHYRWHHYFLQSVRIPMTFEGFFPASVLIFETQVPTDKRLQWDFSDSLPSMYIGLRMGSVGLISVLSDGGVQNELLDDLKDYQKFALHPLQFSELMTKIRYKSLLLNRTRNYILVDGDPILVMQTPIQGLSNTPIFDEWDQKIYAKMLSHCTGFPIDYLYEKPNLVRTWIRDNNGNPLYLPYED